MAEEKIEKQKTEKIVKSNEKEYVIPLREKYRHVARYKKTPKAVKSVKEFLVRHMKVYDRDLRKIKIDKYLNEYLWFRGIKHPPHKVKVKAVKEGDIVRVELSELPEKLKFKKAREERRESKAREFLDKKKTTMQKAKESLKKPEEVKTEISKEKSEKTEEFTDKDKDKDKDGVDDNVEEEEKKEAVIEENKKKQKSEHQKEAHKHKTKVKTPTQERKDRTTSSPAY